MSLRITTASAAIATAMVLGGSTSVLAKAHDMGVADGTGPAAGTTQATVEFLRGLGSNGVSLLTNGKAGVLGDDAPLPGFNTDRGEVASGNGGDNRVEPVVPD